jgi:hypothetical protein
MPLNVKLYNRDFSEPLLLPAVNSIVDSYSHAAIGGPKQAQLTAHGPETALWQCLELLRCPVEISDRYARPTWWGCVSEVKLALGALEVGVSLDLMGNMVTVVYAAVAPGHTTAGTRATTPPSSDVTSIGVYGTKEMRVSLTDATDAQAQQLRDTILAERKWPGRVVAGGASGQVKAATIYCKGWWDTMGWRYFSDVSHAEGNARWGGRLDHIQLNTGNSGLAQSFQLPNAGDAWNLFTVELPFGFGSNDTTVDICVDAAGAPGASISHGTYSGGGVDLEAGVQQFSLVTLDTPAQIVGTNVYWIKLGGASTHLINANLFNPYARGSFLKWTGSVWNDVPGGSPTSDMPFRVNGVVQTSSQIANMVAACSQFLVATDIDNASGLYTNSYRSGDKTAQSEAEALLKTGTLAVVRMLAQVTTDRRVRIYAEPDPAAPTYYMNSDGTLFDQYDVAIDKELCPCAVWVALKDVVPAGVDLANLAGISPFFVEEGSYDARSLVYKPTSKGMPSTWNVNPLVQGKVPVRR